MLFGEEFLESAHPEGRRHRRIILRIPINMVGLDSDSLRAGQSGDRITLGARFSAPVQTGPGAHPASYTMGTGSFPGVKQPGRGVDHPCTIYRRGYRKSRGIPVLNLWVFVACYRVNFTFYLLPLPINVGL